MLTYWMQKGRYYNIDPILVQIVKQFETRLDKFWSRPNQTEITGTGDRSEYKLETVSENTI